MDLDRLPTRCITSEDYLNQQTLDQALVQASISGDLETVETCIIAEASINARNLALFEAVKHGHIDIILSLQANDACLEKSTFEADFISAVKTGDVNRVNNFILAAPVFVHTTNREGYTPLMIAAQHGQTELIKLFIDEGAKLNATVRSYYGNTYLTAMDLAAQYAISTQDSKALAFFIQAQATMSSIKLPIGNYGSNKEVSLFIWASYYGLTDIVNLLLSQDGTIIDKPDPHSNQTPLVWAVSKNNTPTAIALMELGADIQAQNNRQKNLIQIAIQNKNTKLIQYLLKLKHFKVDSGLLKKAINTDCSKVVKTVLNELPNAENDMDLIASSCLFLAVYNGNQRIISLLLQRKLDVNKINRLGDIYVGYTPLKMAVENNSLEITDMLLKAGAYTEWHFKLFPNSTFVLDDQHEITEKKWPVVFRVLSSMPENKINELSSNPRYTVVIKAFKEEMTKIRTGMLAALGLPEAKPFIERFIDNLWALFMLCKEAFGLALVEPKMPVLPKDMIFKILSEPLLYPAWYHHRIDKDLQLIRAGFEKHKTVTPVSYVHTKPKYEPTLVEPVLEPIPEAVIFTKFKTKNENDFEDCPSQEIKSEIAAGDELNTVNQKKYDLIN